MGYPVMLNLAGRLCLVAGAGSVGRRRLRELLAAGARVRLVAPELPDSELPAEVEQRAGTFREEDLDGVFLALAATCDPTANDALLLAARRQGILCARADQPQQGDLTVPAVLRRGPLTVAIATDGSSPLLASLLKERLARQFGPEWSALTRLAGALRQEALSTATVAGTQRQWLQFLLDGGIEAALAGNDVPRVQRLLIQITGDEALAARLLLAIEEPS